MKFGIYYSYSEQEWSADCLKYVEKVAKLGFDVIETAAHHLNSYSPAHIDEVGRSARDNGITITAGLGPSPQKNLSSADLAIRKAGRAFFEETLTNLAKLDIRVIGGALHSYWPIDYSKPVDKTGDRARGLGCAAIGQRPRRRSFLLPAHRTAICKRRPSFGALRLMGMTAPLVVDRPLNGRAFQAYVDQSSSTNVSRGRRHHG